MNSMLLNQQILQAILTKSLDKGKNIYFTPGTYHAKETIHVKKADTIVLGSGMTSIIPDNDDAAMLVDDVDGVRVAGIFLMQVVIQNIY